MQQCDHGRPRLTSVRTEGVVDFIPLAKVNNLVTSCTGNFITFTHMEIQVQDAKEIRLIYLDTRVDANSSRLVTRHGVKSVWPYGLMHAALVTRQRRYTLSSALCKDPWCNKLLLRDY